MAESATVGVLKVLLTADASGFGSALDKAGNQAKGWGSNLTGSVVPIVQNVGLAIAGLGTAFLGLATDAAESGDKIAKAAREAGLSAQSYQELTFAVGQIAEVTDAQLTKAFGRLTTTLGEAADGSKRAGAALTDLGFSQDRIKEGTITTEEAFNRFVQKMREAPTAADAMRIASELLGDRVGPKLAGALREGGDQVDVLRKQFVDLGLGMSGEALAAAEKWNDQTDTLSRQFSALGREIGSAVLPLLTETLIPFIQSSVIPALTVFIDLVSGVIKAFQSLPAPIQGVIAAIGAVIAAVGTITLAFDALLLMVGPLLPLFGLTVPGVLAATGTALAAIALPIAAIGAALVALTVIWVKWGDDIVRITSETFAAVKNWLVDQWEGSILQSFARMLQAMGEFFVALAVRIGQEAQKIFTAVKEWLLDKLQPVINAVRVILDPIVAVWTAAKDKVIGIVTALYNGVKTWLVDKFSAIVDAVKAKIDAVTEFFKQMKDKVVGNSYVVEMVDGIATQIGRLDGVMVQPVQRTTAQTQSLFSGMSTGVQGIVGNLFDSIQGKTTNWSQSFQSIIHSVSGSTQNIFGALSSSVQQIVGGMFNSLLGQATNWGQMFMGILTNIIGAGINSLVAWGLSQLGRLIGGWMGGGEEGTQVNPARNQFLSQFGPAGTGEGSGFWNLGLALEAAGANAEALHAALRQADTMAEFNAAVAAINAALSGGGGSGFLNTGNFSVEAPEDVPGIHEMRAMANGGMGKVDRPTVFVGGEAGAENYAFWRDGQPGPMSGGVTVNFNGPVLAERDYIQTTVIEAVNQAWRSNRNNAFTTSRASLGIG
jgi:hypothetical protein